jgi:ADP-heptose:LPS heptosyltransferase
VSSWNLDCRYFIGDRPCKFKRTCPGCDRYSPMGTRILIVKLAAIGDVLRTTPLLAGLRRRYPESHITWVVDKEALPLLKENSQIDRLIPFDFASLLPLEAETFDLAIGLEKEPRGAALTTKIHAREKKGFALGPEGNIFPLNRGSEYAFLLGLDDDLKFHRNAKSYPEIVFDITELPYERQEYSFFLSAEDIARAEAFAAKNVPDRKIPIVGLNTGAGEVFANKAWTIGGYGELIRGLKGRLPVSILLLGGPRERERNDQILKASGGKVLDTGCGNTLGRFAALVNLCDVVVTGDTTALHLAVGLKKSVVALFGPTCAQEIDLYGRGEKVISSLSCAPCYRRTCSISPNCMEAIKPEEVMTKVEALLARCRPTRRA